MREDSVKGVGTVFINDGDNNASKVLPTKRFIAYRRLLAKCGLLGIANGGDEMIFPSTVVGLWGGRYQGFRWSEKLPVDLRSSVDGVAGGRCRSTSKALPKPN